MLRRLGNKTRLLPKLLELFPENITTFVDMFMGSGAVTFAMVGRCKYIIANDKDEEIFNLFMAVKEHKDELISAIRQMPVHEKLWEYWKKQQEHDCVWKATRFLMLSNFGCWGRETTLHFVLCNSKFNLEQSIGNVFEKLYRPDYKFMCSDFRTVLSKIQWRDDNEKAQSFVYADPPYSGKGNNYQDSFTEQDTQDLFEVLTSSKMRFGISEFKTSYVLDLAGKYGLYVTELGERRTLKNRNTEILITNYEPVKRQSTVFDVLNQSAGRCNNALAGDAKQRAGKLVNIPPAVVAPAVSRS